MRSIDWLANAKTANEIFEQLGLHASHELGSHSGHSIANRRGITKQLRNKANNSNSRIQTKAAEIARNTSPTHDSLQQPHPALAKCPEARQQSEADTVAHASATHHAMRCDASDFTKQNSEARRFTPQTDRQVRSQHATDSQCLHDASHNNNNNNNNDSLASSVQPHTISEHTRRCHFRKHDSDDTTEANRGETRARTGGHQHFGSIAERASLLGLLRKQAQPNSEELDVKCLRSRCRQKKRQANRAATLLRLLCQRGWVCETRTPTCLKQRSG